ncbi:transglycosylase domain-containing protein [Bacillus sp. SM2101]|uniref:transglycosylase domain-containing protein n=1 Tax=Bacillus sp. SM2101 TaxID=2805366 RepID=UPI001BDF3B6D|nr:transglycosylase domain-containing protein [Bacillus sp. SM2101]
MSDNRSNWQDRLQKVQKMFSSKDAVKGARITYGVFWNITLLFIIIGLIGFFFAGGVGAGYFASLVKDEPIRSYDSMKKDIYNYEETTELYFDDNVYLGKLRSDLDREEVSIDDVSQHLINAVVATEDEFFWDHSGIVPKAIMRALFQEVTNSSVRTGGSTLTQQLIKNQILSNEVSFERKAKEMLLALRLEQSFDKDEILEAYLNVSTLGRNSSGRNIAGIQTAAQGIFDVDARDLNIPQSAFIAGLFQSFSYTPFTNKGEIKENLESSMNRMHTVLSRMLQAEFITKEEYESALNYDITADFAPPKPSPIDNYPWLTFEIEDRAEEILAEILAENDGYEVTDLAENDDLYNDYINRASKNLRQNGYKIHTTIDKEIYDEMQTVVQNFEYFAPDKPEEKEDPETGEMVQVMEPIEAGAVLIENTTGKIISFVGGRDHDREQLNHATNAPRSNGSTMKPLLAYGPAMELGKVQPGSVLADVELKVPAGGKTYSPGNYDGRTHGLTSVRYALQKSYNIPAVRSYMSIIDQNPVSYLEKMGYTNLTEGDHYNLSMAIGGLTYGVTVEENVNAYATFGNDGQFVDAYMIERIETNDGEIIYEHESEPVEVFSPQTSYLMIDMMRDVISSGTAASLPGRLDFKSDWAGKTGTAQDFKDAWFVATNPNVTFGVWNGYDTPKSVKTTSGPTYGQRNIYLWADLMNAAYAIKPELVAPEERFKMPGGIISRSYCAASGLLPSKACEEAGLIETDLFNAKYVPTKEDNSLEKANYVEIGEKIYRALETTPEEFTNEGFMFTEAFLEEIGITDIKVAKQLIPNSEKWSNIIFPELEELEDTGEVPDTMGGVKLNGNSISWPAHYQQTVIGYRVYEISNYGENVSEIGIVPVGEDLGFTVGNTDSAYYVTAVDIFGRESAESNKVINGDWQEEPDDNEDPNNGDNDQPGDGEDDPGNDDNDQPGEGDDPDTGDNDNDQPGDGENPGDEDNDQPGDGEDPGDEDNDQPSDGENDPGNDQPGDITEPEDPSTPTDPSNP